MRLMQLAPALLCSTWLYRPVPVALSRSMQPATLDWHPRYMRLLPCSVRSRSAIFAGICRPRQHPRVWVHNDDL